MDSDVSSDKIVALAVNIVVDRDEVLEGDDVDSGAVMLDGVNVTAVVDIEVLTLVDVPSVVDAITVSVLD